ncbi:MAG: hypothetical protein K6E13_08175 [Lachnospiraceae bacterium]|nr:hypothetical protein [Lachnospiraceae bacterium]
MQLQIDMTERDKKLLYRLGLIVIIAIFVLGAIRPLYLAIADKNLDIEDAEATKTVLDQKVALLPTLVEKNDALQEEVDELNANFYEPMYSAEIDEFFTEYMLKKGLMAKDLSITVPDDTVAFEPYVNSELYTKMEEYEETVEDETESSTEIDIYSNGDLSVLDELTDVTVSDTKDSGIYAITVSMKVEGTDANITSMLDDIDAYSPKITVVSCKWSETGTTGTVNEDGELELEASGTKQLQLTLNMFMTGIKE